MIQSTAFAARFPAMCIGGTDRTFTVQIARTDSIGRFDLTTPVDTTFVAKTPLDSVLESVTKICFSTRLLVPSRYRPADLLSFQGRLNQALTVLVPAVLALPASDQVDILVVYSLSSEVMVSCTGRV